MHGNDFLCLTRVVDGSGGELLLDMQSIMTRISGALQEVPDAQRGQLGRALLGLAISRISATQVLPDARPDGLMDAGRSWHG